MYTCSLPGLRCLLLLHLICCFIALCVVQIHAADCGIDKNIDLSGYTFLDSDSRSEIVDRLLNTSTEVTGSGTRWIIMKLRESSSEYRFVKSVTVVPARPPHKSVQIAPIDNQDTTKCVFPFLNNNEINVHRCIETNLIPGKYMCSYQNNIKISISHWSSCSSNQPDGSLSDNIEVLLSNTDNINVNNINWNDFHSCGDTGTGKYNANRTVDCSNNIMNAKYLALRKSSGNLQLAELKMDLYKLGDRKITASEGIWKEDVTTNAALEITGCSPQLKIENILWKHKTFDGTKTREVGRTSGNVMKVDLPKITKEYSGIYYFEYLNKNGKLLYKSTSVSKQVHYKSKFTTPLTGNLYGIVNDTVSTECAVAFGFPYPNINVTIVDGPPLPCVYTRKKDAAYGGQSVSCSTKFTLLSQYDNSKIKCTCDQDGQSCDESRVTIHIVLTTTALPTTSTTSTTKSTAQPPTTILGLSTTIASNGTGSGQEGKDISKAGIIAGGVAAGVIVVIIVIVVVVFYVHRYWLNSASRNIKANGETSPHNYNIPMQNHGTDNAGYFETGNPELSNQELDKSNPQRSSIQYQELNFPNSHPPAVSSEEVDPYMSYSEVPTAVKPKPVTAADFVEYGELQPQPQTQNPYINATVHNV